jgi:dihydropteroate synthase
VVGILNVTPDSFSDGGDFFSPDAAVSHGRRLVADGADIIDIGGESTRPNAAPVSADDELGRVIPVMRALRAALPNTPLSIDTVKATVADAAIAAGVSIVNDVSALRADPDMATVCADAGVGVILMHSRGSVAEMATYQHANYGDVTAEVIAELGERVQAATEAGVGREAIVVDPGIGFSKRTEHSLTVLAELPRLGELGLPVLVGVSRKRFIGEITGVTTAAERDEGTLAANVVALMRGARLFRVHDARGARRALDVAWEILKRTWTSSISSEA